MSKNPWWIAVRPHTLPLSVAPIMLGCALAYEMGHFQPWLGLVTLVAALSGQIAANLSNDYYDFLHGADTKERVGSTRVMAAGLVKAEQMRLAMMISYGLSAVCCGILVVSGGLWVALLSALGLLLAFLYTAGPVPLTYAGLGEVAIFTAFGPVLTAGAFYVQAGFVGAAPMFVGCAMGALEVAVVSINNYRDRFTDPQAGKETLAVRFGGAMVQKLIVVCYAFALTLPFAMGYFLPLLALVPAWPVLQSVIAEEGPTLNQTLAKAARVAMIWALLFTLELVWRGIG